MQNFVNFFTPTIKTNSAYYIPGGDAKVSFVDVRNIAVEPRFLLSTMKVNRDILAKFIILLGAFLLSSS